MKHAVGQTRNGVAVYVDLIRSKAAKHIAHRPYLLGLAKEMLQQTVARGPKMGIEHDMGRSIGHNYVIDTTDKDTIFYGRLVRDDTYTRFVKNGAPSSTQHLTMLLERDKEGSYELCDIWIGHLNPPRPGSQDETAASKAFWSNHAYVFDNQPLQQQTLTKDCPY